MDAPNVWEFFENFEDWGQWTGTYGCQLAVSNEIEGGGAEKVTGAYDSSFLYNNQAVVGLANGKEYYSNAAIQEALHTFIAYDLLVEEDMVRSGDDVHEHDLGMVYPDHSSSPMITGYEGYHTKHGNCNNAPGALDTYKASLTDCTKSAVKKTADKAQP